MRNIKFIVVHCTATPQNTTIESIERFWKEVRQWKAPGYHYVIKPDGEIIQLLDENLISNGAFGHNPACVHIAYIGGVDKDTKPLDNRTESQKHSLFNKLIELSEKYPQAQILGHRDFPGVAKACPSFDVKSWLSSYVPDLSDSQHKTGLAA
jgi:N-acetylmuramoyl-L-alanine amidase